jgi:hypothetical protein
MQSCTHVAASSGGGTPVSWHQVDGLNHGLCNFILAPVLISYMLADECRLLNSESACRATVSATLFCQVGNVAVDVGSAMLLVVRVNVQAYATSTGSGVKHAQQC